MKGVRSPHVLTPEVVSKVQKLLDKGKSVAEVTKKMNLKKVTIRKAIQKGVLKKNQNVLTLMN